MLWKVVPKYLYSVIKNMEKVTKAKKGITQKLEQTEQTNAAKKTNAETKSPYFSPRRTRNKIKIEYEFLLSSLEPAAVAENSSLDVVPIKEEKLKKPKTKPSSSAPSQVETESAKSKKLEPEHSPKNAIKIENEQPLTKSITDVPIKEKTLKKSKAKQPSSDPSKPEVKSSTSVKGKPDNFPIKIENEQLLTKSETESSSMEFPIEEKASTKSESPKTEIKSSKSVKGEPENSSKNANKSEYGQPLTKSVTESSYVKVPFEKKTSNKSKENRLSSDASKAEIKNPKTTKVESENHPENANKIETEQSLTKSETESSTMDVPIEEKTLKKSKAKRSSSDPSKPEIKSPKSTKWEPENWREVIANIKIMRKSVIAPVDTMGCDKCSDENADDKTQRFHMLVALMLSSQTKDQVTYDAMNRLKSRGLNPQNVIGWSSNELEDLLVPVSFYKVKAKHLQKTAQILIDEYNSDIPNTVENLMKLPGVGQKMAHICMKTAWKVISGIGVDVHVNRISNRLKWVKKPSKEPEKTRAELEDWLPSEYWSDITSLLVGFGQTICTANPKCGICLNNQICPSAHIASNKQRIKAKK